MTGQPHIYGNDKSMVSCRCSLKPIHLGVAYTQHLDNCRYMMIYQHDQQSNQQYDNIHRHVGGHYKLRHWIWLPMPLKFKHMRLLDMTDVDVKGTFGYRTTKWYQWAHTRAIYWLNPWNKMGCLNHHYHGEQINVWEHIFIMCYIYICIHCWLEWCDMI